MITMAEALEEELARELGSPLEPIMSKIRGRIPLIIKRCKSKILGLPNYDDQEDAELTRRGQEDTGMRQKDLMTRASSSLQLSHCNTGTEISGMEENQREKKSARSMQLQPKPVPSSSWTTSTVSLDESAGAHIPNAPSAKSLGKRPQDHSMAHDLLPEQPWSTLNTRDPAILETLPIFHEPSNVHEPTASQGHMTMQAEDTSDTSRNLHTMPDASYLGPFDPTLYDDHLSSDFDFDQFIAEFDKG